MSRSSNSPNNEFVPIDFVINVNFDLPVEFYLLVHRSMEFGVNESLLIDSTQVKYTIEGFKVD